MGAAAAEALNKWGGGHAHRGEVGLPLPSFGVRGYYPEKFVKIYVQICAIWYILELKNKHLKQKRSTVTK